MSLLTTKVTSDKTLQELLDEVGNHYAIVGDPERLSFFLTNMGVKTLDLENEDAQDEIRFVQFLTKRYGTKNPFCEKYEWAPNEKLEAAEIEEIKESARIKGTTFEHELSDYLCEVLVDWNGDYDVLNDFYEAYDVDEDDDFYLDLFWDYAYYDYNIEKLLEQSTNGGATCQAF